MFPTAYLRLLAADLVSYHVAFYRSVGAALQGCEELEPAWAANSLRRTAILEDLPLLVSLCTKISISHLLGYVRRLTRRHSLKKAA